MLGGQAEQARAWTLPGLIRLPDVELGRIDPLLMNIVVARGIPARVGLDVARHSRQVNGWALDLARRAPALEEEFWRAPQDWDNCLAEFRAGLICWYADEVLGVRYNEDQKEGHDVVYTDPSDLFLDGVIERRRGTCATMAAFHVAMSWRLGWGLRLSMAGPHFLARYDDGGRRFNIEATNTGRGGFSTPSDEYYHKSCAVGRNSGLWMRIDLTPMTPREMLGAFVLLRGRHYWDLRQIGEAVAHYRLAAALHPRCGFLEARLPRMLPLEACLVPRPGEQLWMSRDVGPEFIRAECARANASWQAWSEFIYPWEREEGPDGISSW